MAPVNMPMPQAYRRVPAGGGAEIDAGVTGFG